ncbi:MAG: polyprenyl synthetase family protein [Terriglobia bacterium]
MTTTLQANDLDIQRSLVDQALDRFLPAADAYPPSIHQAMRYSVTAGGKRLRGILCLEAGRLFNGDEECLLRLASALEMIHTYSLIHDDLPALDNDDLRRGKPTCHRNFGEATAILAGDALLTLAFETLAAPGPPKDDFKLRVIRELARDIGTQDGMIAGQVVDLEAAKHGADADGVDFIHAAKTGALIRASVRSGAVYAGASETDVARVTAYGALIGLAFQIVDDLLDVVGSREALGKSVHKDGEQHKATYPGIYGVEKSRAVAARLVEEACEALAPYGDRAERLRELAHYLIARNT